MRPGLAGFLGFVAGLVLGWGGVIAIYIIGTEMRWWFDRDGGGAMGAIFVAGPFFGLISGVIGAIWAYLRARRHWAQPPPL